MSIQIQGKYFLKINGPLSVVPITPGEVKGKTLGVHILLGPTGSGKSAFIQSISPNHDLGISKDSLESVTRDITCYRVVGLSDANNNAYILMDTPGFLDTRLSESRITKMIEHQLDHLRVCILYFQPITDIRMSGSKRGAVRLARAFAESFNARMINITTTMWNMIATAQQLENANRRFSSLRDGIFAHSHTLRTQVTKFGLSRDSTLSLLDMMAYGWHHDIHYARNPDLEYQSIIYKNLLERITNAQQQLHLLSKEKEAAIASGSDDPSLLDMVLKDETTTLTALQSFLKDLTDIDSRYEVDPSMHTSLWRSVAISQQETSLSSEDFNTQSKTFRAPQVAFDTSPLSSSPSLRKTPPPDMMRDTKTRDFGDTSVHELS
ncbi:hypothetical protein BJ165DRAFT_1402971 [Panaeolus papilionaceus]|nr:hypothetical protein BJ165DRAFT_1402971 [Panaeolus papilionaceus]